MRQGLYGSECLGDALRSLGSNHLEPTKELHQLVEREAHHVCIRTLDTFNEKVPNTLDGIAPCLIHGLPGSH